MLKYLNDESELDEWVIALMLKSNMSKWIYEEIVHSSLHLMVAGRLLKSENFAVRVFNIECSVSDY